MNALAVFCVELGPAFIGSVEMNTQIVPHHKDLLVGIAVRQFVHVFNQRLCRAVGEDMPEKESISDIENDISGWTVEGRKGRFSEQS